MEAQGSLRSRQGHEGKTGTVQTLFGKLLLFAASYLQHLSLAFNFAHVHCRVISVAVGTTVSVISTADSMLPTSQSISEELLTASHLRGTAPLQSAREVGHADQPEVKLPGDQAMIEPGSWQPSRKTFRRHALKCVLADLTSDGSSFIVARGGMGGQGNAALNSRQGR